MVKNIVMMTAWHGIVDMSVKMVDLILKVCSKTVLSSVSNLQNMQNIFAIKRMF